MVPTWSERRFAVAWENHADLVAENETVRGTCGAEMKFVIIGPGAIGSLFAAALARSGHHVTLLGRHSPHLEAIVASGLYLIARDGSRDLIRMAASSEPSVVASAEALVVLVKTVDTAGAITSVSPFVRHGTTVLTLQNGLGNAALIRELLYEHARVLPGVTSQAAMRREPGVVAHTGEGPTLIGYDVEIDAARASDLAATFSAAGLAAAAVPDIDRWIWRKVAVNAAINGLTALGGRPNGAIAQDPDLLDAAETIAEEAAAIARANGIELGGMRRQVLETAIATAENRSSMLQDLESGRPTEVESIHGAIIEAASQVGLDTPAISVVAALLRARERNIRDEEEYHAEGEKRARETHRG